jgi:hypothetical protein
MIESFVERALALLKTHMQEAQEHKLSSEDWAGGTGVLTRAIASHLQTVDRSFRIDRLFAIRKHLDNDWGLYVGTVPCETLQYICYKEYCNVLGEDDLAALQSRTSAENQAVLSRFLNWITSSERDTVMQQGEDAALSQETSTWVDPALSGPSYDGHTSYERTGTANPVAFVTPYDLVSIE